MAKMKTKSNKNSEQNELVRENLRLRTEVQKLSDEICKCQARLKASVSQNDEYVERLKQHYETLEKVLQTLKEGEQKLADEISVNISFKILPLVEKLKKEGKADLQTLEAIEQHLKTICGDQGRRASPTVKYNLTSSELTIAQFVKKDYQAKEIAQRLGISSLTVYNHLRNIRKKLGITNNKLTLKNYLEKIKL